MQFERIRKNHRKEILLGGLILVCIISVITITTTRAKYKLIEDIPIVRGTINYKMPDLRIIAVSISEDGTNYTETDTIPTSGYKLNNEKSICKVADQKDEGITIEYKEGKVNILGVTKEGTRCYLYFDKKDTDTIHVAFGDIEVKRTTPDFSQVAITDEGIYKVSDQVYGGTSYYWRGAVTNNYVEFANKCWRIVRINGDGSIRLIYDGATCHANGTYSKDSIAKANVTYNSSSDNSSYVGWTYMMGSQRTLSGTESNAKTQLESWFSSNLASYVSNLADGKYCNDRNVGKNSSGTQGTWGSTGNTFYYAGYYRLYYGYTPTLSCNSGDVYTLKIGLITADEVEFAGGNNAGNESYYLRNGSAYWTMSPISWNGDAVVFVVYSGGSLGNWNVNRTNAGLRPVVNLKSDTQFQGGGNGTLNNPYVVI